MANPDTPGNETSEHDTLKDVQKWIRIGAALLVSIATVLLSAGVVPEGSAWVAVLSMIVAIGGAITGEVVAAKSYIQGRSAIKVAKVDAAKNPT